MQDKGSTLGLGITPQKVEPWSVRKSWQTHKSYIKQKMQKIFFKTKNNRNGFSLVEVLIAVFILTSGITTIVLMLSLGEKSSIDSRDQVIAVQLSQEGLEIMSSLKAQNGETFFSTLVSGTTYYPDMNSTLASMSVAQALSLDTNGYYVSSGGATATKFLRKIVVAKSAPVGGKIFLTADSYVSWNGASIPASMPACTTASKCVVTELKLYN